MSRITYADLDGMFARAVHAAGHAGISGTQDWVLERGSATYGRAYRLFKVGGSGSATGHFDVIGGNGYLGDTARTAYDALWSLARAWELQVTATRVES